MSEDKFILSGPPDPVDITEGTRSLGEFILHRISQYGDSICHVSADSCFNREMR